MLSSEDDDVIVLVASLALAGQWRAGVGGQLETEGHGLADVGYRAGPWSAELFTDTLDLRLDRAGERGRVSVGVRGAAFAAGLWITPWAEGAPDPDRAQRVAYVGPDLTVQRWLGGGAYVELSGFARHHLFTPLPGATLEVPDTTWLLTDGAVGAWRDDGRRTWRLVAGVDWTVAEGGDTRISPHVRLDGRLEGEGRFAPLGELRLGAAWLADDVVATRLGGMTPYHVPLAGAAWAEHWVEDYAAVRLGGRVRHGMASVPLLLDGAAWSLPEDTTSSSPRRDADLGLLSGLELDRDGWFARFHVGWSPTAARAPGVWPVPFYLHLGTDWRPRR